MENVSLYFEISIFCASVKLHKYYKKMDYIHFYTLTESSKIRKSFIVLLNKRKRDRLNNLNSHSHQQKFRTQTGCSPKSRFLSTPENDKLKKTCILMKIYAKNHLFPWKKQTMLNACHPRYNMFLNGNITNKIWYSRYREQNVLEPLLESNNLIPIIVPQLNEEKVKNG